MIDFLIVHTGSFAKRDSGDRKDKHSAVEYLLSKK